ncbi:membrane protein [Dissulfurispira thermophila]|uniref:Membrane protein n=1 Tax=Dissulfurispira thermophila TaxID=2715679 RepID=A0A7G1H318_9BACT|nr:YeiH family protein [Dissulfurispira thermophila]BCB96523.1 membrane protein [Dissulfurispira thermophila]
MSEQVCLENKGHGGQAEEDRSLVIKTRFFLPPHVDALMPGLMLTAAISALALHTGAKLTYVTPLIGAMGIGMLLRNAFIVPPAYKAGIFFSMRQILRFAVALLGIRITFDKIIGLGWEGLAIALVPLFLTMVFTVLLGRLLKVSQASSLLIGTGTSICGASAILTAGAITRSKDEDIIVAISSITVFGTISMLSYPFIFKSGFLPLTEIQYGQWAGASIHEVAQVVTAAFGGGERSGEIGILIKLTRVATLIPVALILSYLVNRGVIKHGDAYEEKSITFPFFLLGFITMVVLNSLQFFTPRAVKWIEFFDMFLLTMAMAGMGLETDFRQLMKVGYRPLFLSIFATGFITFTSLILIVCL